MKHLYLMRHGEAPSAKSDAERMLNDEGKRQCKQMAQYLGQSNLLKVVTSDYQRAIDSAYLAGIDHVFAQTELLRPSADPQQALSFLCEQMEGLEEGGSLLAVFHLPIISELASLAIDGNLRKHYAFPCASLMKLQSEFPALGCFECLAHHSPN